MRPLQIITDRQVAVVGKKEGRTTLDLWFPDPSDPNNPAKDKALSYLVVVLRDTGKDEYSRWSERQRIEGEVEAFRSALKILQAQIKEAFPDSAVQLSLVGEQVVVRGEAKDIVEAAQILSIVAEHAPISNRRRGIGNNVGRGANVNVNLGYGAGSRGRAECPAVAGYRRPFAERRRAGRGTGRLERHPADFDRLRRTSSISSAFPASSRSCSWSP